MTEDTIIILWVIITVGREKEKGEGKIEIVACKARNRNDVVEGEIRRERWAVLGFFLSFFLVLQKKKGFWLDVSAGGGWPSTD